MRFNIISTFFSIFSFFSFLVSVLQTPSCLSANVATALQTFQSEAGELAYTLFHSGNQEHAKSVTGALDAVNATCGPLNLTSATTAQNRPQPVPLDETFFLPPEALSDLLTITVDPTLLGSRPIPPLPKLESISGIIGTSTDGAEQPRKRGRPPSGAGGRGRGRGRGGSMVGVKRRTKAPSVWTSLLQRQLATALGMILTQEGTQGAKAQGSEPATEALTPMLLYFVKEVADSGACSGMRMIGSTLPEVRSTLMAGAYLEPEEMLGAILEEAHLAAEKFLTEQNTGVRRGKVTGTAEQFTNLIGEQLDGMLADLSRTAKAARLEMQVEDTHEDAGGAAVEAVSLPLANVPLSIQANREPYRNGDWRKTPFVPRPYIRLQEYYIVEEATKETIQRKLRTRKKGGCSGEHCSERDHLGTYSLEAETFVTACSCLSRNTECDDTCGCSAKEGEALACLNRAVTRRDTVKIGEDVEEINSWGMDCYTRRNIQDVLLESQAFGPYQMPNFKAIIAKLKAGVPPSRAAATAAGQHAAVAADSPAPGQALDAAAGGGSGGAGTSGAAANGDSVPKSKAAIERAVVEWIERTLIPAINRQGPNGWDLRAGLADVKARAALAGDTASLTAAEAVESRLDFVGYNYFRVHPKGVGLVCRRKGGLPRLTFVEEYLGEIHTPHRWFELQDAVKKITGDELPDFYNIALERPRDDPDGYDILFVDAAAKGAFASRMSHSCTPNCQAVVMACGGRLTIALYTLRHVHEGEELTFDYSSVTESEKEFREAICLCGTHMCRGSYLYFTGSRAFMQVMTRKHNMLHRQAILCRAGMEPKTDDDRARLKRYGIGNSCLGSEETGDRAAPWLEKWAALICEYLEDEEACLRDELLNRDPFKAYTEATAAAEAKGVVANRVQNVAITLDKVRTFLSMPGQPEGPVLRPLSDDEVIDHLWRGPKSVGKRLLKGALGVTGASATTVRALSIADSDEALEETINGMMNRLSTVMKQMCKVGLKPATTPAAARKCLQGLVDAMRVVDLEVQGGLTAAADIGQLYASTKRWITCERDYKSFSSRPVPINLQDLFLNREATQLAAPPAAPTSPPTASAPAAAGNVAIEAAAPPPPAPVRTPEEEAAALAAATKHANALAKRNQNNPALRKTYRPLYLWGQLNGWFKQTVNDPTASLSAERRGTLSLPDIESCFGGTGKGRYGPKERFELVEHIEKRPDSMWKTGTQWSFRNDAKIYGSPMFDDAWAASMKDGRRGLGEVVKALKEAAVPFVMPTSAVRSSGGTKGRGAASGGTASGGRGRGRGRGRSAAAAAAAAAFGLDDEDMDDS